MTHLQLEEQRLQGRLTTSFTHISHVPVACCSLSCYFCSPVDLIRVSVATSMRAPPPLTLHATSASTSVWRSNWGCQERLCHRPHYLQVILSVRQCVPAISTIHQTSNMTPRKAAVWTFGHLASFWRSALCSQVKRLVSQTVTLLPLLNSWFHNSH